MGTLRLFFTLFAFAAHFAVASAQDASVLDPPTDMVSDGQPLRDNVLLYPLYGQLASNQLDGLLGSLKLWKRQQNVTCATNYTICQGSQFCCQSGNTCCSGGTCCGAGTYCTVVGGIQGCCLLGHICSQIADQCTVSGQQRCPNDNYCCPTGNTCYRDSSNNPRCSSGSPPVSVSTSNPTSTISFVSANPSHIGTSGTPVSTSPSLQTTCQLKPTNQGGLFRRRRQAPVHSGPKRWGWF